MTETPQPTHTPLTGTQLKNVARAEKIIEGLNQGKTYTEIAQDIDIDRTHLYSIMRRDEVQELMYREYIEHETTHLKRLNQLWNSPNPTDKRTAIKIMEQRQKRIQDKLQPTLHQTHNLNITADLQKYQTHLQTLTEAINQLPPTTKQQLWNNYNTIEKQKQPKQP